MATHFKQILLIVFTLLLVILVNPFAQAETGSFGPISDDQGIIAQPNGTQTASESTVKTDTIHTLSESLDVSGGWINSSGDIGLIIEQSGSSFTGWVVRDGYPLPIDGILEGNTMKFYQASVAEFTHYYNSYYSNIDVPMSVCYAVERPRGVYYELIVNQDSTLASGNSNSGTFGFSGETVTYVYDGGTPEAIAKKGWISLTVYRGGVNISGVSGQEALSADDPKFRDILSFIAEPIDAASGAHTLERSLLTLHGARELNFTIDYNSLLNNQIHDQSKLGRGWNHNFQTKIEKITSDGIILHWNPNRKNTFTAGISGQYRSDETSAKYDSIVQNADGTYTLTRSDQSIYQFDAAGKLVEEMDRNGRKLLLTYDANNNLQKVSEPVSGAALNFSYNTKYQLVKISDSSGRQVTFTYDTNMNFKTVTDAGGYTTTYTYDSNGRVLSANFSAITLFTDTYDSQGRVIAQKDAVTGHPQGTFAYDESSQPGQVVTTYTNRDGKKSALVHDRSYRLISKTDENGNTGTYSYDANGNRTSSSDGNGNVTNYTYDDRGNLLTVTDPTGNVTTMTYDARNNLLTVTRPDGKIRSMTYDQNNNLLGVTDEAGDTTTYTYDSNSLMTSSTVPDQGTSYFTNTNGLPSQSIDSAGVTMNYTYDTAGRINTITDADGNTTAFSYDPRDNITSVTDPLGHTVSYTYDSRGNKLTETDAKGNITRYAYNNNNKMISKTDALGIITTYAYDNEDRLVNITDGRGNTSNIGYDAAGRAISATDAMGNGTTTQYDAVGNITGMQDPSGASNLTKTYNNLNLPTGVSDALGNTTSNGYDDLGRITSVTDPKGKTSNYSYDQLSRLKSVTDPLSGTSLQTFDAAGNRTSLTDPNGNNQSFSYDSAGRIVTEGDGAGNTVTYTYNNLGQIATRTNGRGQTTSFSYDADGRISSMATPEGTVSYTYDPNDNLLTVTDSSGTITRSYDALNQVISYRNAQGKTIGYQYDQAGNLIRLTYPNGKTVNYTYDAANRLTQVSDWASRITSYSYDQNSRLIQTTRPDGSIETRSYDAAGRLIQQIDLDAKFPLIAQYDFTYDANGNVVKEMTSAILTPYIPADINMTYGSGNRLETYDGQNVIYDADGNMTSGPLNVSMGSFAYDSRNRLIMAGDTSYSYDAENNRIAQSNGAITTTYVVNPQASLSQILQFTQGSNTSYCVYGLGLLGIEDSAGNYEIYHYDLRGSMVGITDMNGNVTGTASYGPYGELAGQTGSVATPFLYNGRDGVMTDANGLYFMRARYYQPKIKRFINQDVLLGDITNSPSLNRYAYVNGQPVNMVDPWGLSAEESDAHNSRNILYNLWVEANHTYFKEPIDRMLSAGVANVHSFKAGEYGSGMGAYIKCGAKHVAIMGNYLVEQADATTFGFSKNPIKIIKTVVRAGVDTVYETGQAAAIKQKTDQIFDALNIIKGPLDISYAQKGIEAVYSGLQLGSGFFNYFQDY